MRSTFKKLFWVKIFLAIVLPGSLLGYFGTKFVKSPSFVILATLKNKEAHLNAHLDDLSYQLKNIEHQNGDIDTKVSNILTIIKQCDKHSIKNEKL